MDQDTIEYTEEDQETPFEDVAAWAMKQKKKQ